ncbi:MAG TPA: multidrug DMT transporter permease [Solibacterales bacterium]|nr:multidrug DMT transporter permease [Bryobacterales bacterium]
MFTVEQPSTAILLCVVTMLGWGSWANTQKLAGKEHWPFELFYWDYAIGGALMGALLAFTLGMFGHAGESTWTNLHTASPRMALLALFAGAVFNVSNILLVAAIDASGMALAFPVGVGLALVLGTGFSYIQAPQGNLALLVAGVGLILVAMLFSALAHRRLPAQKLPGSGRGLLFAIAAGLLMGFFYPQLMHTITPAFNTQPVQPGMLTPYSALLLFGAGLLLSNFPVNGWFMRSRGSTFAVYAEARPRVHAAGILGGCIWMVALGLNVIASGVAGPAISYALGQGATLVAALWGIFVWHEYRGAPAGTRPLLGFMLAAYATGIFLIGTAVLGPAAHTLP